MIVVKAKPKATDTPWRSSIRIQFSQMKSAPPVDAVRMLTSPLPLRPHRRPIAGPPMRVPNGAKEARPGRAGLAGWCAGLAGWSGHDVVATR